MPRIRIRRDPYVLRISCKVGVVRHFSPTFSAVVQRHYWYEPRVHWKLLLRDDSRVVREATPAVPGRKARRRG